MSANINQPSGEPLNDEMKKRLREAGIVAVRGLNTIKDEKVFEEMLDFVKNWKPGVEQRKFGGIEI